MRWRVAERKANTLLNRPAQFASDPNEYIRGNQANANTPLPNFLAQLASDQNSNVRRPVTQNPNTLLEIFRSSSLVFRKPLSITANHSEDQKRHCARFPWARWVALHRNLTPACNLRPASVLKGVPVGSCGSVGRLGPQSNAGLDLRHAYRNRTCRRGRRLRGC